MKLHSREWFAQKIAEAKADIKTWPQWMQNARHVATASFPLLPGEQRAPITGKEGGNAT